MVDLQSQGVAMVQRRLIAEGYTAFVAASGSM